jgi:putative membrane protein
MINFVTYFGVALILLVVGLVVMELTTKNKEYKLIAEGNKAASYLLGGRVLALSIVLYSALANAISLLDLVIWGSIAVVAQIIVFYLAELLTPNFNVVKAIDDNNEAVGIFLMLLSIAIGVVIAGSITY